MELIKLKNVIYNMDKCRSRPNGDLILEVTIAMQLEARTVAEMEYKINTLEVSAQDFRHIGGV